VKWLGDWRHRRHFLDHPGLFDSDDGGGKVFFLAHQPEAGLASLGTGTLNDLGSDPKTSKHEEGEDASHRSLHIVACSNFRSLEDAALDAANLSPLPVAGNGSVLSPVYELGQGNICMMAEDVDVLEVFGAPILELDAEEVAEVGRRAAAELDSNCGSIFGDTEHLWVVIDDAGLVEERNERLVGSLDQEELERVAIESDAFQSREDSVEQGTASDVSNAVDILV